MLEENEPSGETCDKCGRPMVVKRGRFGVFLACSGYPDCKNTHSLSTGIPCPREGCKGQLVERTSKSGRRFYGCNRYPGCKTAVWGRLVPKTCPVCGAQVLLEKQDRKGGQKLVCIKPSCKHQEAAPFESHPPKNSEV